MIRGIVPIDIRQTTIIGVAAVEAPVTVLEKNCPLPPIVTED
jgi:hypothetical protein